jgi:hypothetical protein
LIEVLQYSSDRDEVRKKLGLPSGSNPANLPQPMNAMHGGLPPPMNSTGNL